MMMLARAVKMIMVKLKKNLTFFLFFMGFLISIGVLAFTFFLELDSHLVPCSLCIFQRVFLVLAAFIFLIFLIHFFFTQRRGMHSRTVIIYALLGFFVALMGLAFSLRQIYLQSLPPGLVPGCGPGLNFLFKAYPFLDALKIILQGSGDCAKIDWRALGLSLADWAGIYFVVLMILNVVVLGVSKNGRQKSAE